ncbi:MAG: GNAT family N-acetyltransferase [Thermoleophilia bacterium]|nr:GNAT family N-acetyltransferase [Thermoleophilia bacterium]
MTNVDLARYVSSGGELPLSNLGQLELLRGMMERGLPLRTRVLGFSMMPSIRDGDFLTIAPIGDLEPRMGEVVAFVPAGTERLILHRVVGRQESGWLVRGDNCSESDGLIAREEILGKVVRVEREGCDVGYGLGRGGPAVAWLSRAGMLRALRGASRLPLRAASCLLRDAQGLGLYRAIGRRIAPCVEIVEASAEDLRALRRDLHFLHIPARQQSDGVSLQHTNDWVVKRQGKVVGFAQLLQTDDADSPCKGHWLFSLVVKTRFRGLGMGEALTLRVIEEARSVGAPALLLAAYEDNRAAITLYSKLGFQHSVVDALEPQFEAEKRLHGRRRIVMRKDLI